MSDNHHNHINSHQDYELLEDKDNNQKEEMTFALKHKSDQNLHLRKKKRARINSNDNNDNEADCNHEHDHCHDHKSEGDLNRKLNYGNDDNTEDDDYNEDETLQILHKNTNCNDINTSPNKNLIFANVSNVIVQEKKLAWLCFITFLYFTFVIFEIICGYYSNSITLMSDAAHSFSDCLCFAIYIVSIFATRKGTTTCMSFGFHRGEIIGMVVSVTIIWGLSFWLIYSATYRLILPVEVNGLIMLLAALVGLIFNLAMGILLIYSGIGHHVSFSYQNEGDDCGIHFHPSSELSCETIRGTFKHILGDLVQSGFIVFAGGLIFIFPHWSLADPICTFIFTFIVLLSAFKTLKDCIGILMEGAPIEFDLEQLGHDLLDIKGVIEVHDLHVWSLSIGKISLSCHLTTTSPQITLKKAREMIKRKYNITHTTIQVELDTERIYNNCEHDLHY